ncbi:MAG: hypothetical protein ACJ8EN_15290, partial [Xanthobacteraceae bacterium]
MSASASIAKMRWFPFMLGLGAFAAVILVVEIFIRIGLINRFIVPMPSEILKAFPRIGAEENVLARFRDTALEAFSASILVGVVGITGGVALYQFRLLRE